MKKSKYNAFSFAGVLPHVPRMLPVLVQDPELRQRAAETFMSQEFQDNIEEYFVQNIKVRRRQPMLSPKCMHAFVAPPGLV